MSDNRSENGSRNTLSVLDGMTITVGVVIGVGIFKTPSLVAAAMGNGYMILLIWCAGGMLSLIGALCYAELASTYPHEGGEYHYLTRAYGPVIGLLFVWARITIIQTGSIALFSFVIGDYASEIHRLGPYSSSVYAAGVVVFLTGLNISGRAGVIRFQKLLVALLSAVFMLALMIGLNRLPSPPSSGPFHLPAGSAVGRAMILVMLTYGGWNEAAYISAEIREAARNMVRLLVISILSITMLYVAVNMLLVKGLGTMAMAGAENVAADFMRGAWGDGGVVVISILIVAAALSSMNGTIITGARTAYALGNDIPRLQFLGLWDKRRNAPVHAYVMQCAVTLVLIFAGTVTRGGFEMMVDYTAPAFWLFFLLAGVSLFVLRRRDPDVRRPFRVPMYPFVPALFCMSSAFMLYASVRFTGLGAVMSIALLVSGIPLVLIKYRSTAA